MLGNQVSWQKRKLPPSPLLLPHSFFPSLYKQQLSVTYQPGCCVVCWLLLFSVRWGLSQAWFSLQKARPSQTDTMVVSQVLSENTKDTTAPAWNKPKSDLPSSEVTVWFWWFLQIWKHRCLKFHCPWKTNTIAHSIPSPFQPPWEPGGPGVCGGRHWEGPGSIPPTMGTQGPGSRGDWHRESPGHSSLHKGSPVRRPH